MILSNGIKCNNRKVYDIGGKSFVSINDNQYTVDEAQDGPEN